MSLPSCWQESPCAGCLGSPCCHFLPLATLKADTRADFERLALLSRLEGMRIILKDTGEWVLFFHRRCSRYSPLTTKCLIHNEPLQSKVCHDYSPYRCWYRKAFSGTESLLALHFDATRLDVFINLLTFEEGGNIDRVPDWNTLAGTLSAIPLSPQPFGGEYTGNKQITDLPLLIVPPGKPRRKAHLDLFYFRLNFPGIRALVYPEEWLFVIPAIKGAGSGEGEIDFTELALIDTVIEGIDSSCRSLLLKPPALILDRENFAEYLGGLDFDNDHRPVSA